MGIRPSKQPQRTILAETPYLYEDHAHALIWGYMDHLPPRSTGQHTAHYVVRQSVDDQKLAAQHARMRRGSFLNSFEHERQPASPTAGLDKNTLIRILDKNTRVEVRA